MKRSLAVLVGIAAVCVALDQWTKSWATHALAFTRPIRVIDDLVRLTYTRNSGIAFGLFAGRSFPFYVFSIVAAAAVFWLYRRHPNLHPVRQLSLALILGGAVGNLIDRVKSGEVVDFILLSWRGHEFPVFNVADVCVTCGVALFALVWSRDPEPQPLPVEATVESHGGVDGAGDGGGTAGGSLAGPGTDRPLS